MNKITPKIVKSLKRNELFVFGSNIQGRHSKGAALAAINFGAVYGKGEGHFGQTYAIPTREYIYGQIITLSLEEIKIYVDNFINYAKLNRDLIFLVTPIGTGLAGLKIKDVAPLFMSALYLENVYLPEQFLEIIKK